MITDNTFMIDVQIALTNAGLRLWTLESAGGGQWRASVVGTHVFEQAIGNTWAEAIDAAYAAAIAKRRVA